MLLYISIIFIPTKGIIKPPKPYIKIFEASNLETEADGLNLTPRSDNGNEERYYKGIEDYC